MHHFAIVLHFRPGGSSILREDGIFLFAEFVDFGDGIGVLGVVLLLEFGFLEVLLVDAGLRVGFLGAKCVA